MDKLKVNLLDRTFSMCGPSAGTGSTGMAPKHMEWVSSGGCDITVFTDAYLQSDVSTCPTKYKIGWIIESRSISPHLYTDLSMYNKFDYVLTHDRHLLETNDKFVFTPLCGHWIYDEDCKIHPKTQNCSIIASNKRMAPGHLLRHEVIAKHSDKIQGVFGNGYQPIENKIIGLKDYRYHIVIENIRSDYWFTEKLIDAFVTGCIPIYYGTPNIGRYFNTNGILTFETMDHLDYILEEVADESNYNLQLLAQSIQDNFVRAQSFLTPEDYMYRKLFRKLK